MPPVTRDARPDLPNAPITSLQNAQLKRLLRLRERRERTREGLMLIEGARELARALGGGVVPEVVYTCPELFSADGLADMRQRLASDGRKFNERVLPRLNMTQLFTLDPDGIDVELNFDSRETGT